MKNLIPAMLVSACIWATLGAVVMMLLKDDGSTTCALTHSADTCYNALNR